jgi:DNA adenine methylase
VIRRHQQPFLRWAGSKRQLLPILSEYWRPQHRRYVEPFAGSACLFFWLGAKRALLGDLNEELIETYRQLVRRPDSVISELSGFLNSRANYLRLRALNPADFPPPFRAARFIYLNRFCFNGLYRTNNSGAFNVPYGGQKAGNVPSAELLRQCSQLLTGAVLVSGDFELVLQQVRRGDFVYLDPPFCTSDRRIFREYGASSFGAKDIQRLRSWIENPDGMGIPFVLSYADCKESHVLARGFSVRHVVVRRNISGFMSGRSLSSELLISNSV